MRRIVVVGGEGLLGESLVRGFKKKTDAEVKSLTRSEVDLSDVNHLEHCLRSLDYDVLINAAAMSGLEECLDHPELAFRVNAEAPRIMAQVSDAKKAMMVQISTDYVFAGDLEKRLTESDQTQPISHYGRTKLEGEKLVQEASHHSIVARVSWLFGRGRETFVDKVISSLYNGKAFAAITDKYSVPNACDDLFRMLDSLIEQQARGTVHLTNMSEPESWHSYGLKVMACAEQLGLAKSNPSLIEPTRLSSAHFFRDARPKYTAMVSERLDSEFGIHSVSWMDSLEEYLIWFVEHRLTKE